MHEFKYLALGDSYTIGEAVPQSESFPFQLTSELTQRGILLMEPRVIAVTGWTTSDLLRAVRAADLNERFDLVTLLIGVNNQYQGLPADDYRKEFVELLDIAGSLSEKGKAGVVVLSIPDWSVMPFAAGRDLKTIAAEIDLFNKICREESAGEGVRFVDIRPVSRLAATDPELIAEDGLHPSGKMYGQWVEGLLPHTLEILG